MTITELRPVDHHERLRVLPNKAAAVDYACNVLDAGFTTAAIRTWLSDHGIETDRSLASKRVNKWRRDHGLTTTGEMRAITPGMIAAASVPAPDATGVPVAAEMTPEVATGSAPAPGADADGAPVASVGTVLASLGGLRAVALVVPLVLVNTVAITGQVLWGREHLAGGLAVAVLFACALESIALFLAAETHAALMNGDSSALLRLASYAMAGLAGSLNYLHYAPSPWSPNVAAVAFGILSTVSPWLWGVRSRSMHRAELRTCGLIDPRAVRFSPLRWALFPGTTFRAFRRAAWLQETDPARASALAMLDPAEYDTYLRSRALSSLDGTR